MTNNRLIDRFNRTIDYLRVSVTDRCNLRCTYCSTDDFPLLEREEILTLEELARVVRCASEFGIKKVRITGGEPLIRKNIVHFIQMLHSIDSIEDLSITTNGTLLQDYAGLLFKAGIKRLNISLDTLKRERFVEITGRDKLNDVLRGIDVALETGFSPVKLNVVVIQGSNEDEILDFAELTREKPLTVRFIEHMPIHKRHAFFSLKDVQRKLEKYGKLIAVTDIKGAGPAHYMKYEDAPGRIGIIAPMSEGFCERCNRLRLTADGHLYVCLMNEISTDIKKVLRSGGTDDELKRFIRDTVQKKPFSPAETNGGKVVGKPMASIGG